MRQCGELRRASIDEREMNQCFLSLSLSQMSGAFRACSSSHRTQQKETKWRRWKRKARCSKNTTELRSARGGKAKHASTHTHTHQQMDSSHANRGMKARTNINNKNNSKAGTTALVILNRHHTFVRTDKYKKIILHRTTKNNSLVGEINYGSVNTPPLASGQIRVREKRGRKRGAR